MNDSEPQNVTGIGDDSKKWGMMVMRDQPGDGMQYLQGM